MAIRHLSNQLGGIRCFYDGLLGWREQAGVLRLGIAVALMASRDRFASIWLAVIEVSGGRDWRRKSLFPSAGFEISGRIAGDWRPVVEGLRFELCCCDCPRFSAQLRFYLS